MKRILLIIMCLVFGFSTSIFAVEGAQSNASKQVIPKVTLISEDGTEYVLDIPKSAYTVSNNYVNKDNCFVTDVEVTIDGATINSILGGKTSEEWDSSISVEGYVSIKYDSYAAPGWPGSNMCRLDKVSGGWTVHDSSVTMSNRQVSYTCQDPITINQRVTKYPSGNTFSYNTGFTQYVRDTAPLSVMGGNSRVTLKHGSSSSWIFQIDCNAFENY